MRIDCHHHIWLLARGDYTWLTDARPRIYRDFPADELKPLLDAAQIDATIAVQAAATEAETEFLLTQAQAHDWIVGVIGWVDIESEDVVKSLERFKASPKFKGIRPLLAFNPDPDWILQSKLDRAFDALRDLDLIFEWLVQPHHLTNVLKRLDRHPEIATVIDHFAKPDLTSEMPQKWATDIKAVADYTNAYCKFSGLMAHAGESPVLPRLSPAVDHVLDAFGPERLMFASDWPVMNETTDYKAWVDIAEKLLAEQSDATRGAIFGENARCFYGI